MFFRKFINFIDSSKLFPCDETVLLAVSGGLDSTVMVHLFARAGFRFAVAHCHFQLRGADSDQDFQFTENLAETNSVPFHSVKFDTQEYAGKHGLSIQMAARELRYLWFEEIRQKHGFQYIATAHHLDDQAETILINLIRGTGIAGMHGIPVKSGRLVRPLMFARRNEISEYASEHEIKFREDLSNNEVKYLRNKIRHDIIPIFNSINPVFVENLNSSVRKISDYEKIAEKNLHEWKSSVTQVIDDMTIVDLKQLLAFPQPETLAWFVLSPFGFNETQIEKLINCLDKPEEKVFASPTHTLRKERNRLIVYLTQPSSTFNEIKSEGSEVFSIPVQYMTNEISSVQLRFNHINHPGKYQISKDPNIASLDFHKLEFPLTLRKWQPGDSFHPFGMKGKKKLSDFFIDLKLSDEQKKRAWLLCSNNQIVWIVGYRIDHRYRVTGKTEEVLLVER